MSVTCETSQESISWLKGEPPNMFDMSVTLETSQEEMSWSKAFELANIDDMSVTLETSHAFKS